MYSYTNLTISFLQSQDYAKPHKEPRVRSQINDLDSMLGSLQSNMNRKGVDVSSKVHTHTH